MKEIRYDGNLFLLPDGPEAAAVTTNGIVKSDGRAVMGAGIAKYARDSLTDIDVLLGRFLSLYGNHAYFMGSFQDNHRAAAGKPASVFVVTMPTKNDWRDGSDLELIRRSAVELMGIAARNNLRRVYLPAPGCALGRLDYKTQVRPAISNILDDRFTACLPSHIFDRL